VAYAVSGDASASGDQRLHEGVKLQELTDTPVGEVMQQQVVSAQAALTLHEFAATLSPHTHHEAFPVFDGHRLLGAVTLWAMVQTPPERWRTTRVRDLMDANIGRVAPECDVSEALRLLLGEHRQPMLLVVSGEGEMRGIVTKTDILHALKTRREDRNEAEGAPERQAELFASARESGAG
jgi:chloride channel protein, CIC family